MSRRLGLSMLVVTVCVPFVVAAGCKRVPEIVSSSVAGPAAAASSSQGAVAASTSLGAARETATDAGGVVPSAAPSLAPAVARDAGGASASGSIAASASAPGAAPPGSTAAELVGRIVGYWAFSHFDLTDEGTKALWEAVPADMKKEVLASAPEATLEITRGTFAMRLLGVPEKKYAFTIDPALAASAAGGAPDTVTLMTDSGRKRVRVIDNDTIRVEELDRKEDFVTIFARKKSDPAPVVSGTPRGK